jgi:hypothetical protein
MVLPSDQLVTMIVKANFAKDWFEDAYNEVTKTPYAAARRREIIFAVCATESYLFEWARDILISKYPTEFLNKLTDCFPENSKKPITEKWKDVPKKLWRGLIEGTPDLRSCQTWRTFREVYKYRNALIHAAVSWPKTEVTASLAPARDWKAELGAMGAGQAIEVVAELMRGLNDKAGTPTPDWLDLPKVS